MTNARVELGVSKKVIAGNKFLVSMKDKGMGMKSKMKLHERFFFLK